MIIICTNTGRLRAFHVTQSETHAEPLNQIREIVDETFDDGPQRVGETTSDKAGRFRQDGSPGMAHGEAQGLEREDERRLIHRVAERVSALVKEQHAERWHLAAPQAINARIIDELDPAVRGQLSENQKHDLTKMPTLEVGRRFGLIK